MSRLAEVERLLLEGMADAGSSTLQYHRMRDALVIVREMRALVESRSSVEVVEQRGADTYCGECGTPVCEHVARGCR